MKVAKSTVIWLGLASLASASLFQTSYKVQESNSELAALNHAIIQEQEAIQILKAEWSYMNDPSRIEEMAQRHLVLGRTKSEQMITSATEIPEKDPEDTIEPSLVSGIPIPSRKPAVVDSARGKTDPIGDLILATYENEEVAASR